MYEYKEIVDQLGHPSSIARPKTDTVWVRGANALTTIAYTDRLGPLEPTAFSLYISQFFIYVVEVGSTFLLAAGMGRGGGCSSVSGRR